MKINLKKIIAGALLVSSVMSTFAVPKFNSKKVDYTTDEAAITNSTTVMLTSVAGDNYAIGYVSLVSLNDSVKAVKIGGANDTVANINNGSYKISRPFNIAVKEGLSPVAPGGEKSLP